MFKREHHVRIATILQALDADILLKYKCLFGGGTAIALLRGEYRESVDIDFLISDHAGYRPLRTAINDKGLEAITRSGLHLDSVRDIRTDQYGIRTMLRVAGIDIKFEIVLEGRIALELPESNDRICGISTLTLNDMATSKLLANSDRWRDDSVFSRDLIDLAMLEAPKQILSFALEKSRKAYGDSVNKDLEKAIQMLKDRKGRLEECMEALKIDKIPKALLWKRIRDLRNLA